MDRIEVRDPVLSVSAEMLISLAAAGLPSQEPPPVIAAVDPSKGRPQEPSPEPPSIVDGPQSGRDGGGEVVGDGGTPAVPTKPPVSTKKRPLQMEVVNGRFRMFSIGQMGELMALDDLDLVFAGSDEAGSGNARLAALKVLKQTMETDIGVELQLAARILNLKVIEEPEKPMQLTGNGRISINPALPFEATVGYRSTESSCFRFPALEELEIAQNQTFVQCAGFARVPMSWRALVRSGGEGLVMKGAGLEFDRYGAAMVLQNGVFQVPDFRLLGDQASLLGNGWVNRESGSGVIRLVVSSAAAEWVKARLGVERMDSLDPGNRQFLDVDFWRNPTGWMADLDGRTVPLSEIGLSGR
ncbi:hypothetical protein JIN81_03840 [Haloferula rosea]|uniref:Uncharacterized protein n=2 Tax=Haloferula rosea TaxID=490093 RepID=A0A934RAN6_9BACT|nr:hypothetical protein [Haloferula rosea]